MLIYMCRLQVILHHRVVIFIHINPVKFRVCAERSTLAIRGALYISFSCSASKAVYF